jgi:hypothetical protein
MSKKYREWIVYAIIILIIGYLGFIVGKKRVSLGEQIIDTTHLKLSLDGMCVNQNPSDSDMLDVQVEITGEPSEKKLITTAFQAYRIVDQKLSEDVLQFERIRVQVFSDNWQRDYVMPSGYTLKLDEKEIGINSFWADTINIQPPETKMINSMARSSVFEELVQALFTASTLGADVDACFSISYGNDLMIEIHVGEKTELFDFISDALIATQVSAEQTHVFLEKVIINAIIDEKEDDDQKRYEEMILIEFDYKYLDMLTNAKISLSDFMNHVYISSN